jgi:hypothetical protein
VLQYFYLTSNSIFQNLTAGSCNQYHATTAGTGNRLASAGGVTYKYNAAGNMTYDGSHNYYYDAENRLIQVDGILGTCSSATLC